MVRGRGLCRGVRGMDEREEEKDKERRDEGQVVAYHEGLGCGDARMRGHVRLIACIIRISSRTPEHRRGIACIA